MSNFNDGNLLDAVQRAALAEVAKKGSRSPGKPVEIPQDISNYLNAVLTNALLPELLALRARERTVSTETLRMTVR
jgi:hypothetical protein